MLAISAHICPLSWTGVHTSQLVVVHGVPLLGAQGFAMLVRLPGLARESSLTCPNSDR